jgi:hypothetical protein
MEHEMKHHQDFRAIKDAALSSEPVRRTREPENYANGKVVNADPQLARRVFQERDAQAVEGSAADERMDRPGRFRSEGGRVPEVKATPDALRSGPAWLTGLRAGTPVQNNPSGKSDQRDVDRPRPVTY